MPMAKRMLTAKATKIRGECLGVNWVTVRQMSPTESAKIAAHRRAGLKFS